MGGCVGVHMGFGVVCFIIGLLFVGVCLYQEIFIVEFVDGNVYLCIVFGIFGGVWCAVVF